MSGLAEVLTVARQKRGLSQSALARRLGVSSVTVNRREAGRIDVPGSGILRLAQDLDCVIAATPDGWQIVEPGSERRELPANADRDQPLGAIEDKQYQIPLLGCASAGPGTWNDHPPETISVADRWLTKLDGVIEVHGDSMEPLLENGDLVGARLGEDYTIGDVVIAIADWGECLIKVFGGHLEEEGLLILTSLNPSYAPIVGRPDVLSIQGVAYGLLRAGGLWV